MELREGRRNKKEGNPSQENDLRLRGLKFYFRNIFLPSMPSFPSPRKGKRDVVHRDEALGAQSKGFCVTRLPYWVRVGFASFILGAGVGTIPIV